MKIILGYLYIAVIFSFAISEIGAQEFDFDGVRYRNFLLNDSVNRVDIKFLEKQNNQNTSVFPIIKTDFMVNTLAGNFGCEQSSVSSAIDGYGNRMYVWLDKRNDLTEMYAQFYDTNGNKVGSNFKINDHELLGNNSPFVTANENGNFVVTYLVNFSTVVAQRFSSNAQKIGNTLTINTTSGWNTTEPSAAVNNDGSFLVMWGSEQGDNKYKLYARLVDALGNFITPEIIISEPNKYIASIGHGKHTAVDGNGNYCITFSAYSIGERPKTYLQILDRFGNLIEGNKLVSEESSTFSNFFPEIASINDGTFLMLWSVDNDYPSQDETKFRIYNINSGFINDITTLDDSIFGYGYYSISSNKENMFYVLTGGYAKNNILKIKPDGTILSVTAITEIIFPDQNSKLSYDLTDLVNNRLYVSMTIRKKSDNDIYYLELDSTFLLITNVIKVNDDILSSVQRFPVVGFNKYGQSIVLWEDSRDGWPNLYAQVYDENFNPINNDIKVNDYTTERWFLHKKIIKAQSDGTFIIAFSGSEGYYDDEVYLQLISSTGEKIGSNLKIKDKAYDTSYDLAMSTDSTDETLVVLYTRYGASIKRFDKNLTQTLSEKYILKSNYPQSYYPLTISVDDDLNIFAVWKNYDYNLQDSGSEIFGQYFYSNGVPASVVEILDSTRNYILEIKCQNDGLDNYALIYKDQYKFNFKRSYEIENQKSYITIVDYYGYQEAPINILKFKNKKLFATYNTYNVARAIYINDNKRTTEDYELFHYPYINNYYDDYNGMNSSDIFEDKMLFTYESSQNGGTSRDIWAKANDVSQIEFGEEWYYKPVNSDFLYDNYPNPFNGKTKIVYELLAYHKVKLSVYDILGSEVRVLKDENQEKGIYELEFDSDGLASGVYFLRLDAFDTTIKKMVILK